MHRILSEWLFGVVDDTARAALMLALAGAAVSLEEHAGRRSGSQCRASKSVGDGSQRPVQSSMAPGESGANRSCGPQCGERGEQGLPVLTMLESALVPREGR